MARDPRRGGNAAAYQVGYGKPPEHTRFRLGRSGNPAGRPKGALDLGTLLGKALGEKVAVKDGAGRRRRITKAEAVVTQLVNKAAGADLRAIRILLALEQGRRAGRTTAGGDAPEAGRSPEPGPASRPLDVRGMTTEELCIVHEAMLIIDRRQEPPPHPVPPRDPGEDSE